MSDNQSENSANWQAGWQLPSQEARGKQQTALEAADIELEASILRFHEAEHALEEARQAVKFALGRRHIIKDQPTWRDIFCPKLLLSASALYDLCTQTGYKYALWNDCIYRADTEAKHLVDTGVKASDIK